MFPETGCGSGGRSADTSRSLSVKNIMQHNRFTAVRDHPDGPKFLENVYFADAPDGAQLR